MRPSFPGKIHEIPGIGVDNFNDRTKRAYFLSHCHGDHISGLKELPYSRKSVCIYMSEISAAIAETHFNKDLKRFIQPLLGKTTILLPADEENSHEEMYVEVTPIPAGHCFGAVMFLFETSQKKILYTGDFRITENDVSKLGQLHDVNNKPIKLDALYVDTTFQDAIYETFPKRSESIAYVVREIKKWIDKGDEYRVALEPSARYGYEFVFNKIYENLKMKVYVTDENWELYSKFLKKLPGVTNDDESSTKIHVCSARWAYWKDTKEKKYCVVCPNDIEHKYLYISFCALKWKKDSSYNVNPDEIPLVWDSDKEITVCFSTHCSRSELVHFVEYLSPKKIVGFSDPYQGTRELTCITPSKRKTPNRAVEQTIEKRKKVPKHVIKNIFG